MSSIPASVAGAATLSGAFGEIDKQVLGSPASSMSVTGIAAANRMFRITGDVLKDGSVGRVYVVLNNDTNVYYTEQKISANNASKNASRDGSQRQFDVTNDNISGEPTSFEMHIGKELAGTEAAITWQEFHEDGSGTYIAASHGGLWDPGASTGLINRIDLVASATNFDTGAVYLLEGNLTT
jgi:hypothetical protein